MDFWDVFFLLLIFVPLILMWSYAMVDIFRRDDLSGAGKAFWLLAIFVIPFLGTLLYLLFRPMSRAMLHAASDPVPGEAPRAVASSPEERAKA